MAAKVPVILSTDVGNEIDDQWAIAYLMTEPAFDVRGLLSAHAPSLPDPSAHSTFRILQEVVEQRLALKEHPPLLEGASLPLANVTTPRASAAATFIVEQSRLFNAEHRLNVVVIGAATDMASALLLDPSVADRVRVVAMALKNLQPDGAHEYNEQNDPDAWRVLLASHVPLVVGTGDVCRQYLSLNYAEAESLLRGHGPVADWLWSEYQVWYFRNVKPLRVPDFSRPWVIWDVITLAYLRGMASTETVPRPTLDATMTLRTDAPRGTHESLQNITAVETAKLWAEFVADLSRARTSR
jgi:purine nucleosidase